MAGDQRLDVEFGRTVEAEAPFRHLPAQQAIGADHLAACDGQDMVAHVVETADVATGATARLVGRGGALLEKHAIPERLRGGHVIWGLGEPDLQFARARQDAELAHVDAAPPRVRRLHHGKRKNL
jgi:hypothetical protein